MNFLCQKQLLKGEYLVGRLINILLKGIANKKYSPHCKMHDITMISYDGGHVLCLILWCHAGGCQHTIKQEEKGLMEFFFSYVLPMVVGGE